MQTTQLRSRLLLIGSDGGRALLRAIVPEAGWAVVEAAGFEQACFVHHSQPCDVVVLDGVAAGRPFAESLAWLVANVQRPVVLVCDGEPEAVAAGLRQGAKWLPADAARRYPELFAATLEQAVWRGEERRRAAADGTRLREAYGRIDRLLGLLWEAAPGDGPTKWYSQRHMLERLDEEVARLKRRGGPLSVVLGEVRPAGGTALEPEQAQKLAGWVAQCLAEHKRRCDVAGRYGLDGFMLLLPRVDHDEAEGACRRLGQILTSHDPHGLPPTHVRFGHASAPGDAATVQALLSRAEERLGQSRDAG